MEEKQLQKRYGLVTAIAMVVGIVIGSGVFFKAEKILVATGGDLPTGILAWFLGGLIMVVCAYVFATMATKYEKVNGIVDYAEVAMGSKYGYFVGWFMATIYYPTLTGVLSWVSARYTCVLLGLNVSGSGCMILAAFFLISSYTINTLSPKLAGIIQVSTTIIKIIPLVLMAIFGVVIGLKNGILIDNFTSGVIADVKGNPLFTAVVASAFAYEGWIVATSINAELKDAKRNLPLALTFGTIFVVIMYILYYVGLAGAVENRIMMNGGEAGAKLAFSNVFTNIGGVLMFVFVVVSCIGTLNGVMLGCTRGFYSLAARKEGPRPEVFGTIDSHTNMPANSSVLGLFFCILWLVYFYGANISSVRWFGAFSFDSSELPIVTIYTMYIPIFVMFMIREKSFGIFKRIIMPGLGVCACVFMLVAACYAHGIAVAYYLIIFAVIMAIGVIINKKKTPLNSKNRN